MAAAPPVDFDAWFRIADADRDGVVTGAEAVAFFSKSGLPKKALATVWDVAAGGQPSLDRRSFVCALHLISLAQQAGGSVDVAAARKFMSGLVAPPPPPRMEGLFAGAPAPAAPSWSMAPPAPAAPAPAPAAAPDYGLRFSELAAGAGTVSGQACFAEFMATGVPKAALKDIWAQVAGDQGYLTRDQFVEAYARIDALRGGPGGAPGAPAGGLAGGAPGPAPAASASMFSDLAPGLPERLARPPPPPAFAYQPSLPSQAVPAADRASLGPDERRQLEGAEERARAAERAVLAEEFATAQSR